jgi:dethiobiotin synthetase
MTDPIIITGTDTGIGKTVFAAALAGALGATYWKPVQAGLTEETDSECVARLSEPPLRILPEAYRLKLAASPHLAAACEGIEIDLRCLMLPPEPRPLVVEMAGGLMMYPAWVLAEFARLCRHCRVLLIADEVMTGFGRTGTLFACDRHKSSRTFYVSPRG